MRDPERAQRVANRLGHGVRRRELEGRDRARRRHDGVHRRAADGEPGAPHRSRSAAAPRQGSVHGPAAGADAGESADARPACGSSSSRTRRASRPSAIGCRSSSARSTRSTRTRSTSRRRPHRARPVARRRASPTLERELAAAQAMYTDQHPKCSASRTSSRSRSGRRRPRPQQPAADRMARLQRNPAYRQLIGDREMARGRIRELERDSSRDAGADRPLSGARRSGADGRAAADDHRARLRPREAAVHRPVVQAARGRDDAANVERNRSGEQFEVLYPATLPDRADQADPDARDARLDSRRPLPRRRPDARREYFDRRSTTTAISGTSSICRFSAASATSRA